MIIIISHQNKYSRERSNNIKLYNNWLYSKKNKEYIAIDTETGGLNYNTVDCLLLAIGDKKNEFIFTGEKDNIKSANLNYIANNLCIVGHNLKFDLNIIYFNYGIRFKYTYDTYITEQRLWQGLGKSKTNGQGISFSLEEVLKKYKIINNFQNLNKNIRKEFINQKIKDYIATEMQINYVCGDIKHLLTLLEIQQNYIKRHKKEILINDIEQPLVKVLSKMETRGLNFNKEKWLDIADTNYNKSIDVANKLDILIKSKLDLKDEFAYLIKDQLKANRQYVNKQSNLFGEINHVQINSSNINYDSPQKLIILFAILKGELPSYVKNQINGNKKHNGYAIPKLKIIDKKIVICESNSIDGYLTGEPFLIEMLKTKPNHKLKDILMLYLEYSKYSTNYSSFGYNFLNNIDINTGKVYTIYRQADAITGRLQSGGGGGKPNKANRLSGRDITKFNSQNIPRKGGYRECFYATNNYSFCSSDLVGAEATIITDYSRDPTMKKFAIELDDVHSPTAEACWKNIYLYRALDKILNFKTSNEFIEFIYNNKSELEQCVNHIKDDENYIKYLNLVINKKENTDLRNDFKSSTFGTFYGMYAEKAAKTLNISIIEGGIVIATINKLFSNVNIYMQNKIDNVCGSYSPYKIPLGYLQISKRTGSVLFFKELIEFRKLKLIPSKDVANKFYGNIRNSDIQGTQADMIKECMVELQKVIDNLNLDVYLLLNIHDEILDEFSDIYLNPIIEYKNNKYTWVELKEFIMTTTCNKYLSWVTMKVESNVNKVWKK